MSNPDKQKHADLSETQASILAHTSANCRYYTGEDCQTYWAVVGLELAGFLDRRPGWDDSSFYFYLTAAGRERLQAHWRAICSYPRPKPPTKRQRQARERWERVRAIREATGLSVGEIFKRAKTFGYA